MLRSSQALRLLQQAILDKAQQIVTVLYKKIHSEHGETADYIYREPTAGTVR